MDIPVWKCERCGHKWLPRILRRPKRCPLCKSPYWYKVKKLLTVKPVRTVFAPSDELKEAAAPGKDGKSLPFLSLRELDPSSLADLLKLKGKRKE